MVENTVIITAENKEKTISRTIKSCIDQTNKKFEIIIAYSKLRNEKKIKQKFNLKNIFFYKIKKKLKNKVHDQIYKIKQLTKISRGKNIFLLDGDDLFNKKKIETISKLLKLKNVMILDEYKITSNQKKFTRKIKSYKENFYFKELVNDWPKDVCTSAISIKKSLLLNFFNTINFKRYNFLAIDILLAIYCNKKDKLLRINKNLTYKVDTLNSVDKSFIGLLNKYYWLRRMEQHIYNMHIKKKKYLSVDFLFTYIICFLIKNTVKIKNI